MSQIKVDFCYYHCVVKVFLSNYTICSVFGAKLGTPLINIRIRPEVTWLVKSEQQKCNRFLARPAQRDYIKTFLEMSTSEFFHLVSIRTSR